MGPRSRPACVYCPSFLGEGWDCGAPPSKAPPRPSAAADSACALSHKCSVLRRCRSEETCPTRHAVCFQGNPEPPSNPARSLGRFQVPPACHGGRGSQRLPTHGQRAGGERPGERPWPLPRPYPSLPRGPVPRPPWLLCGSDAEARRSWSLSHPGLGRGGEPALEKLDARLLRVLSPDVRVWKQAWGG